MIDLLHRLFAHFLDLVLIDVPGIHYLERSIEVALRWLHDALGVSWVLGFAIIAGALRILIAPLSVRGKRATLKLVITRPYVASISRRYDRDRPERERRLYDLYRDNGISFLPVLLPMLVQIPIFAALYRVLLRTSVGGDASRETAFGVVHDITRPAIDAGTVGIVLIALLMAAQVLAIRYFALTLSSRQMVLAAILTILGWPIVVNLAIGIIVYYLVTYLLVIVEHFVILRCFDFTMEFVEPADDAGVKRTRRVNLVDAHAIARRVEVPERTEPPAS